jgi:hypothetical protein
MSSHPKPIGMTDEDMCLEYQARTCKALESIAKSLSRIDQNLNSSMWEGQISVRNNG